MALKNLTPEEMYANQLAATQGIGAKVKAGVAGKATTFKTNLKAAKNKMIANFLAAVESDDWDNAINDAAANKWERNTGEKAETAIRAGVVANKEEMIQANVKVLQAAKAVHEMAKGMKNDGLDDALEILRASMLKQKEIHGKRT